MKLSTIRKIAYIVLIFCIFLLPKIVKAEDVIKTCTSIYLDGSTYMCEFANGSSLGVGGVYKKYTGQYPGGTLYQTTGYQSSNIRFGIDLDLGSTTNGYSWHKFEDVQPGVDWIYVFQYSGTGTPSQFDPSAVTRFTFVEPFEKTILSSYANIKAGLVMGDDARSSVSSTTYLFNKLCVELENLEPGSPVYTFPNAVSNCGDETKKTIGLTIPHTRPTGEEYVEVVFNNFKFNDGQHSIIFSIQDSEYSSVLTSTVTFFTIGSSTLVNYPVSDLPEDSNVIPGCTFDVDELEEANTIEKMRFSIEIGFCNLFVPKLSEWNTKKQYIKTNLAQVWPWGYVTRVINIMTEEATTTLPSFTVHLGGEGPLASTSVSFDVQEAFAGGAVLLNEIEDPRSGKTFEEIARPLLSMLFASFVVLIIVWDVMGTSSHHSSHPENRQR